MVFDRARFSANLSHPEFPLTPGIFILKSHPGVVGSSQFDWSLTHTGNDCEKAQRQTLVIRWPCVLFSVSCLPNAPNPHAFLFCITLLLVCLLILVLSSLPFVSFTLSAFCFIPFIACSCLVAVAQCLTITNTADQQKNVVHGEDTGGVRVEQKRAEER